MNEILLAITALLSVLFILTSWKLGKERLYSCIIILLLLISVGGGKIVEFFGYETNTGNVFYAAVFLATYFLIERFGKKEGLRSIWIGTIGTVFFLIFVKITAALQGSGATLDLDRALSVAVDPTFRISVASITAYILSQNLNVRFYIFLKEKWGTKHLWLRANLSNLIAQTLDSMIFFVMAFWGLVVPANMIEIILMSLIIKTVFMAAASPLLYFNTVEYEESRGYSSITMQ